MCVVIPFILDVRLVDEPAGVTQEEGRTGFLDLPSRRCLPSFSSREGFSRSFPSSTVTSNFEIRYFIYFFSVIADGPNVAILPVVTKDLPMYPRFTLYEYYRDHSVNQWLNFTFSNVLTLSANDARIKILLSKY